MRTCSDCGHDWPAENFSRQREPEKRGEERTADGQNPYCRACARRRERRRQYTANPAYYRQSADRWRAANPEKRKAVARNYARKVRWARFGITPEQAEALLVRAAGCCEACGDPLDDAVGVCIDHCHDRNAVRGVLCAPCNRAAGHAKDDPARLDRLAAYLRAHGT